MKCKLKKISHLSGNKASVYSVVKAGETKTLFETFLAENYNSHLSEISQITKNLQVIGHHTGASEGFFKHREGEFGDGVCALYDLPKYKLRLYCIRFGAQIIILGGGGPKPKNIKTLQQSPKLKDENYFLRWLSKQITLRLNDDLKFSPDGLDFIGDLEFEDEEDD